MRPSVATALVGALLAFWLAANARADYLFNWDPVVPTVYSDQSGMRIDLSDEPQSPFVSGSQNMVATALRTFINPGVEGSDTFTQNTSTTLKLAIVDGEAIGTLEFGLMFSGSLSAAGSSLSLSFLDETTKALTINGELYTVSLTAPSAIPGEVQASIRVGEDDPEPPPVEEDPPPPPVNNAPEPSSLALACLGVLGAALCGWRWLGRRAAPVLA
jgi:hypothetical protein